MIKTGLHMKMASTSPSMATMKVKIPAATSRAAPEINWLPAMILELCLMPMVISMIPKIIRTMPMSLEREGGEDFKHVGL